MKKINCLVVDDEPVARKLMREFTMQTPFLSLAGEVENAIKAGVLLQSEPVDLIFLDIEMPKLSGLDWLKKLKTRPLVILVTAFPNYALEGYDLDIIDYLLKPVSYARFLKAAQKANEYYRLQHNAASSPSWIFVRTDKRIEKIELADILYVESVGNYVNIATTSRSLLAYLTLKGIESQLPAPEFIKVHQSFLVNFSRVEAMEGNTLKLKDKKVPVSRNHRDELMKLIETRLLKR